MEYIDSYLLSSLYARKAKMEITVNLGGRKIDLDVDLTGLDGTPDCCIGHFGYNFFIRTPYGLKRKRYSSFSALKRSCLKVLKNKGIVVLRLTVKEQGKAILVEDMS